MHHCAEDDRSDNHETDTGDPLAANIMSGPIRKVYACQWIKTEPVEENETSDVFHQFQSEPVDKSERKGDIKHESLTGVGLSCGQMSSGTTGDFEQSYFEQKHERFKDFERDSSRNTEPVYLNNSEIKVKFEDGSEADPEEAVTGISVNEWQPDISNSHETEYVSDIKFTDTSMDEDEDKSFGDEQEDGEPCHAIGIHQDPGSNKPATSVKNTRGPYVCDVCEKTFTQKRNLTKHQSIHTGVRPFMCVLCLKSFRQKVFLDKHMLTHTDVKPFVCDVCEKGFKQKQCLKRHMLIHTGLKPFVCDMCEKSFVQKHQLKSHMVIHAEQKPFECDVCGKALSRRDHLEAHMLTHSDQKPFVCDVCEKGFTQQKCLMTHKLIHTGHKPFVCDVCDKSFIQKSSLKSHQLVHSGKKSFVCDVCQESFAHKSTLKNHQFIHSGVRQFVCELCDKSFSQKRYLKTHMLSHDNKPFVCDVCQLCFKHRKTLSEHRLIHNDVMQVLPEEVF